MSELNKGRARGSDRKREKKEQRVCDCEKVKEIERGRKRGRDGEKEIAREREREIEREIERERERLRERKERVKKGERTQKNH